MESKTIKALKERHKLELKKATEKENAKINKLCKDFSLGVLKLSFENKDLSEIFKSQNDLKELYEQLCEIFASNENEVKSESEAQQ